MDTNAIYVLWLREMKRFIRARSRVIGILIMPLFFLLGLGLGLGSFVQLAGGATYLQFLVPGIIGMSLMSTAISSGFSVIWDRQFGFLKEIMVTPNSRASIVVGRVAGGSTTALFSAIIVVLVSLLIGFNIHFTAATVLALVFMVLIAMTFISLGLILASVISDIQGFGLITNFFTMPLLFLSNSIFPLSQLPAVVQDVSYVNPLTYGIDGLRYTLTGSSLYPLYTDLLVMIVVVVIMVSIAVYAFSNSEVGQ
jgi:ABC-2 type transport system permease protein